MDYGKIRPLRPGLQNALAHALRQQIISTNLWKGPEATKA